VAIGPIVTNKIVSQQAEMSWTSDTRQEASWCLCISALDICGISVDRSGGASPCVSSQASARQTASRSHGRRKEHGGLDWQNGEARKSEVRSEETLGGSRERKEPDLDRLAGVEKSAVESKFRGRDRAEWDQKSRTTSGQEGRRAGRKGGWA
jgi:hypothetical protein